MRIDLSWPVPDNLAAEDVAKLVAAIEDDRIIVLRRPDGLSDLAVAQFCKAAKDALEAAADGNFAFHGAPKRATVLPFDPVAVAR